jgi:CHRD domain
MKNIFNRNAGALLAAALFTLISTAAVGRAQDSGSYPLQLKADLISFNQVPAVLAKSSGHFEAEVNMQDRTISYSLSYANMSSQVVQAHIHFGASKTNGGVMVFLCGGISPTPCPTSGTVTGTLTAADVSLLPVTNPDSVIPQGIEPKDFAGMLKAIRSGNAYVNVHTVNFPSGEIRGQVKFSSSY